MGDDGGRIRSRKDDPVSRFLTRFPTKIYFEEINPQSYPGRRVFWSQNQHQNSDVIHDMIKSAFSSIDVLRLKGLVQFWASVTTTDGRHLLSTSDQPFVLEDLDHGLCKYRLHSVMYQYSIDDHINHNNDNTSIISNGFVATAFHNRFPEVLHDLRQMISIEEGRSTKGPLVYHALDCDLTSSILLPVFYHGSSCVGVVECCMKLNGLLIIFDELKSALERVGLTTYRIQDALPDMAMDSFKRVGDEIENALKFVCESHHLDLGQVWIPYYDNYVPFTSSSLEDPRHTKPTFAVRLSGYCFVVDSDDDPVKDYYEFSSVFPRKLDEGLPGKTLTTYRSHFCRNLCRPRKVRSILEMHSGSAKCSCFTICLKSVHTADLDYAFEFFWPRGRNYLIVLESLLSILKMCLPSFKFPFGAELGEELCILDVENSTKSRSGSFKIFKGDRLSKTLGAMEETRSIADEAGQQNESTSEKSERDTNDQWLRPKHVKRKLSDLSDGEDEVDIDRFWDSDHDMLIEAYYKNEFALFNLCSSYTLANVRKIIEEKFMLDPGTYGLGYQTKEWGWAVLNTDEKLANCKKHSRRDQKSRFKVSVLPLPPRGFSVQQAKPLYELFSGKRKFLSTKVSK